ncbi:CD302 antigen-like [Silurus asotus]|uniref:CD302 antigen-like n=1 Tax=Silurus asotus TaxID=30991 RepID=A0AAD5FME5_SILAS|nr:CD302 antigen-like [Silurus asotus]
MKSRVYNIASLLSLASFLLRHCARAQSNGDCPADGRTWVPFGQSCYHFVHGEEDIAKSYTLEKAKDMCRGFALLTVRNAEVNDFIVQYNPNVWKDNVNIWLGLYYDSDDDQFKWNDESVVNYKNWVEGGSADWDIPKMDKCVALHSTTGKWENISCSEKSENGVVCEAAQKAVVIGKKKGSPLLSALVILSVIAILGVSAVVWFFHQRNDSGSTILPSFEYHPPFRAPSADQMCLVEAEELEETS